MTDVTGFGVDRVGEVCYSRDSQGEPEGEPRQGDESHKGMT